MRLDVLFRKCRGRKLQSMLKSAHVIRVGCVLSLFGLLAIIGCDEAKEIDDDTVTIDEVGKIDDRLVDQQPTVAKTIDGDVVVDGDGAEVQLDSRGRAKVHVLEPVEWGTEDRGGDEGSFDDADVRSSGVALPMASGAGESAVSSGSSSGSTGDSGGMTAPPPAFDILPGGPAPYPFPEGSQAAAYTLTAGLFDDHLNVLYYESFIGDFLAGRVIDDQPGEPRSLPLLEESDDESGEGASDPRIGAMPTPPSQIAFRDTRDAVRLQVLGADGAPVSRARVEVLTSSERFVIESGTDGRALFIPGLDIDDVSLSDISVRVTAPHVTASGHDGDISTTVALTEDAPERTVQINLDVENTTRPNMLDLAFIVDATGSMSDELAFIVEEIEEIAIRANGLFDDSASINSKSAEDSKVIDSDDDQKDEKLSRIRFALIVYRDVGDAYVTRGYGFSDLAGFKNFVKKQRAGGGGDYPEAMQTALVEAAEKLPWREGNVARVAFLLADAPPHDEDVSVALQGVDMLRKKGVRLYPVASSGVQGMAEYVMRSAAYLTQGRYLFLTDDSGVGNSHAEPHIPCYNVGLLQDQMMTVIGAELSGGLPALKPDQVQRQSPAADGQTPPAFTLEAGVCVANPTVPLQDQPVSEI